MKRAQRTGDKPSTQYLCLVLPVLFFTNSDHLQPVSLITHRCRCIIYSPFRGAYGIPLRAHLLHTDQQRSSSLHDFPSRRTEQQSIVITDIY